MTQGKQLLLLINVHLSAINLDLRLSVILTRSICDDV